MGRTRRTDALIAATFVAASMAPLMAPLIADASPKDKPVIVFESHVGSRPAKLAPFLHAVNDQLETRGYAAFPASVLRLAGDKIPRPGILDPDLTAAALAELHSSAFAMYKAARCGDALALLTVARDKTRRNPALVANDIGNHDLMFRTLVAIADCHKRLGDDKAAREAMKEVRRVYPTRPVSRADAWGPSGEELYVQVTLDERGVLRGRLTIGAGDPNAQIAVEGQLRGVGNVSLADLLPGVYRVFIRTSARDPGRQYDVVVKAGEETRFTVDIHRDELLHASEEYVALTYPSESARKDECKLASHFAERWTASGATLVLASGEENGRPIVVGMRCRDGVQVRRAVIFTDTDEATTPEKLVPFLDDITAEEPPAVTRDRGDRSGPLWPKLLMGTAALGLAGSTTLYLVWPDDDFTQPEYDDKKTLAVVVYSGAAGLAGVGVYSWLTTSRHMRRLPAAMFAAGTTSLLLAAMYIPSDEDLHDDGWQRPTYRNTALAGAISAGVGVGFAVAGYLFMASDSGRGTSAIPTVIPARDGLAFGLTSSF